MVQKFTTLKQTFLKLQQPHYDQETFQKIGQQIIRKKTGFNGNVYDLYGYVYDYDATDVDDIKNIHKYLMKKNDIV